MNRRNFLKGLGSTFALTALGGLKTWAMEPNKMYNSDEIFVYVFLRGGMDALNLVAPVSDKAYIDARPKHLRIGESEGLSLKNTLNDLDFALHPKAKPLKELYDDKKMAIIHACGLTNGTRSHFDAMALMERGIANKGEAEEGWLSRYLNSQQYQDLTIPAIALSPNMPDMFLGAQDAISVNRVNEYQLDADPRLHGILRHLYDRDTDLDKKAQRTLASMRHVYNQAPKKQNGEIDQYHPEHGAEYPREWYLKGFGESLANLAALIKMDVGVNVASVDFGGWDTHEHQNHHFNNLINGLSRALMAFYNDLKNYHKRLTILVMSEFGRRVKANKSDGTDHGHGGLALVIGGSVNGGKMYGEWLGLENDQLDNRVDLAVTTDYRTILAEIATKKLAVADQKLLFPNFGDTKQLGFLA